MKTFAAGAMLLLAFLISATDDSFAGSEHCAKDFWGNCQGTIRHHAGYQYRHCVKDFWGRCNDGRPRWRHGHRHGHRHHHHDYERRSERHHHHHHHDRHYRDLDRGSFCHHRRRVAGTEEKNRKSARESATEAWMGAVRYDHGERYQDINRAKDVRYNCDQSSTGRILGTPYYRCVVEATPCRAPIGSSEPQVERRYEVEEDDDKK